MAQLQSSWHLVRRVGAEDAGRGPSGGGTCEDAERGRDLGDTSNCHLQKEDSMPVSFVLAA